MRRQVFFLLLSQRSHDDKESKKQTNKTTINLSAGVTHGGVLCIFTFHFALAASVAVERLERVAERMEGRGRSRHTLPYGIGE